MKMGVPYKWGGYKSSSRTSNCHLDYWYVRVLALGVAYFLQKHQRNRNGFTLTGFRETQFNGDRGTTRRNIEMTRMNGRGQHSQVECTSVHQNLSEGSGLLIVDAMISIPLP